MPVAARTSAALGLLCLAVASTAPLASATPVDARDVSPSSSGLGRPSPSRLPRLHPRASVMSPIGELRGGGDSSSGGRKKQKRKGKSSKRSSAATDGEGDAEDGGGADGKGAINEAIQQTDAATALGDAIRARADILRADRLPYPERTFDTALVSLGLSMGTAGTDKDVEDKDEGEEKASPEVEALAYYQYGQRSPRRVKLSTASLIGSYFLKSHGGTHLVQCLLSLLASVLGMACLLLPAFPSAASDSFYTNAGAKGATKAMDATSLSRNILLSTMKYQLMQQTLLLAMAKHASGLMGAAFLGASRIPQLGVRNARRYIEPVAHSPVGQYLFYCSLLVVWMGWFGGGAAGGMGDFVARLRGSVISIINASAAAASSSDGAGGSTASTDAAAQLLDALSQTPPPWFLSRSHGGSVITILILGPILLREVISVLWAVSDVLTLAFNSSDGVTGKVLSKMLQGCRSILDAFMSVLISSEKWRKADSYQRQRTLAKLVARCSLVLELAVGGVVMGDAVLSLWGFALGGPSLVAGGGAPGSDGRLPFKCVLGKMACAHLYLNFLLSRRKKIAAVVDSIRGGAEK